MDLNRFDQLLARMERSNVAAFDALLGCTEVEVVALESKYSVRLPDAYAMYLRLMGHKSGRLFTHDHMAVFYSDVLDMTQEMRERLADEEADEVMKAFALPVDALLIAGRLGDQFQFIRCHEADDSEVWFFDVYRWQVSPSSSSIIEWLEGWCEEAEHAIASGYFGMFPDGTTP